MVLLLTPCVTCAVPAPSPLSQPVGGTGGFGPLAGGWGEVAVGPAPGPGGYLRR